jgi:hypothetical protein
LIHEKSTAGLFNSTTNHTVDLTSNQAGRSGCSEIDFRLTVDSSRNQLLYSSTVRKNLTVEICG